MKCPKCGGTGFVPTNVFGVNGAIKCDFCDGTGVFITNNEEPQTGQEWLQTATTEQLAEWIVHLADDCTMQHECNLCNSWCDEKRVMEWLKQPYKPIS